MGKITHASTQNQRKIVGLYRWIVIITSGAFPVINSTRFDGEFEKVFLKFRIRCIPVDITDAKEKIMKITRRLPGISLLSAMILAIASFQAIAHESNVTKPAKKILLQAPLAGMDGLEMTVAHVAVPAGFVGGKHKHPGPVFVYVLEGELTVELDGVTKTFKAGELYPEDIDAAMVGRNMSTTDDLKLLIFHAGGIGKPEKVAVN